MSVKEYGLFPIWSGWLSQPFSSGHNGIDIGFMNKDGYYGHLPVRTYMPGTVVQSSNNDGKGGVYVVVKHMLDNGNCQFSAYWHLIKNSQVAIGTVLAHGDKIGIRDSTGISSGTHLHFMLTCELPGNTSYSWNTLMINVINPIPYLHYIDGDNIECPGISPYPKEIIPDPVARDTTKHQVQVLADNLRIRTAPAGEYYCTCAKGIFNVLAVQTVPLSGVNFQWFEIETDRWIAFDASWATDLPIQDKDQIIKDLTSQVATLSSQITTLNNQINDNTKTISDLTLSLSAANTKIEKAKVALNE